MTLCKEHWAGRQEFWDPSGLWEPCDLEPAASSFWASASLSADEEVGTGGLQSPCRLLTVSDALLQ